MSRTRTIKVGEYYFVEELERIFKILSISRENILLTSELHLEDMRVHEVEVHPALFGNIRHIPKGKIDEVINEYLQDIVRPLEKNIARFKGAF